jgi:hypothetical protein
MRAKRALARRKKSRRFARRTQILRETKSASLGMTPQTFSGEHSSPSAIAILSGTVSHL